jgi:heme exporter protein B
MTGGVFGRLVLRDMRAALQGGGLWLPLAFFLILCVIYPFAIGSDAAMLRQTGGGMLWIAALLASLLPVDRIVAPDVQAGVVDQLVVRGVSEELIILAKWIAHLITLGVPLLLAAFPGSILQGLDAAQLSSLLIGLAIGLPGLTALGVLVAALGADHRGPMVASSLAILPFAIPILIFGAGSVMGDSGADRGGLQWLAATSLLLVALLPFAGGAALRAARG